MKIKTLTFAVLAALCSPVFAEDNELVDDTYFDDFYGSEEMVEIATGIKTQIYKAPAVASVFTADQIKNIGATDIDDVLEAVPGLHVSRVSNSYNSIYTFRGVHSIYNPQVLMLINGIPITNNFWGNRNQIWGGMSVESIARIEVIRGPGSAVYGADAFSGVINIITKNADDINSTELGIRGGSQSTRDAWLSVADSHNELKYALTLEYHKTDGSDNIIHFDAQTNLDMIFGTEASLAPGPLSLATENIELRTEINYREWTARAGLQTRNNVGVGAGLGEALDPTSNQASDRFNVDIGYKKLLTDEFELELQAAYFDTTQEIKNNFIIFPPGADVGFGAPFPDGFIGNPEVYERHYRLNATALYSGVDNHTFRFGLGYHKGDMYKTKESKNFGFGPDGGFIVPGSPVVDVSDTPYVFIRETDRTDHYAFVQDVWTFAPDWELTAGVRFDDYSDFGSTTNPRIAMVWSTTLNLSTKFLYGQAFRAPSFADTGIINNPVTLGNPNLQPEEMETFEFAFDYHPRTGFGTVWNFYKYDWRDIIQYVPDAGQSTNTAQNAGKQSGYGTELELNWNVSKTLKLASNFAWSKATNDLTHQDAAFVPKRQLYVQLDYKISDELRMNIKSNWVSARKRDSADIRKKVADYLLTDLTLRWASADMPVEFALLAKNIFDEDAREPSINNGSAVNLSNDLPLSGRTLYGEIRYHF